jgi:hypothetical protein
VTEVNAVPFLERLLPLSFLGLSLVVRREVREAWDGTRFVGESLRLVCSWF